ncbi:MAG: aspartate/glutamate racemase family protein [Pseudomonadota bacterium]
MSTPEEEIAALAEQPVRASVAGPILVINPNSNEAVTEGLCDALAGFRAPGWPLIECVTLAEGPFGIESQVDSDAVVMPLVRLVESRADAAAHVIACYSDPGLDACRSVSEAPVFGIQEAGVLSAMARGDRFGVIAIAAPSVARHRRFMRRMGVLERLAGERALDMSVDETARGADTFDRLVTVGEELAADGADVVVLGCAGMARHRAALALALGLPVIDPVQAAVAMALGAVLPAALG